MPMTQKIREIEQSLMQHEVWKTDRDIDSRDELKINSVSVGSDESDESSSRTNPVKIGSDNSDKSSC